jgi:hypothetical protein
MIRLFFPQINRRSDEANESLSFNDSAVIWQFDCSFANQMLFSDSIAISVI